MYFDNTSTDINKKLDACIANMTNCLKLWQDRQLSLIGKVVILKSLAISKLIYIVSSVHIPQTYMTQIQEIIRNFLWSNGPSKIRQNVIQMPIKDGGIKAPNFDHQMISLRVMWVKRFMSDSNAKWKYSALELFHNYFNLKDIFFSRCAFGNINLNVPPFYLDVLKAWNRLKALFEPKTPFDVKKEFTWFNPYIKINNDIVFFKNWYKKGIKFINDLLDQESGNFLSHDALNDKYHINASF